MADESSPTALAAVKPMGVPHRLKMTEVMNDSQWHTLLAIMDTIIPSIQKESQAPRKKSLSVAYISDKRYNAAIEHLRKNTVLLEASSQEQVESVLAEKPSDDLAFRQQLQGMLLSLPQQTKNQLLMVLTVLRYVTCISRLSKTDWLILCSTQGVTLPLTGTWTPFTRLPLEGRTRVLQGWSRSIIPDIRGLFRQMNTLAKVIYTATNPRFLAISGYPHTPVGWSPHPTYPFQFIQFPEAPASSSSSSQAKGKPQKPAPPIEIEYDIVIVGSGCGAGVCAKILSEAGYRVVVVEKGYHFDARSFPMAQGPSFFWLLDGAGAVNSDDNAILIVSGANLGGGGTINWSASLQPQGFVRKEWSDKFGLTFFATQAFQDCCDRVCAQMGVHEAFTPNHGNQALLDGARKLGWAAKKVPQNTGGCEHADGQCALGCASGEKKGPVNGWFPDAARAGCQFIEGFKVERVLFDEKKGKKKAIGVEGTWTSRGPGGALEGPDEDKIVRKVIIRSKRVVVSGGTMWSPIILKNSGLKVRSSPNPTRAHTHTRRGLHPKRLDALTNHRHAQNPQIGRNLHLHPVNVVTAVFKEDVRPWEGGILTAVVNSFEDLDGQGHGVKLEATCMVPCYASQFLNWDAGVDFKLRALKLRHMNSYIAIVRDRDAGAVYPDPHTGVPRVAYTPSAFDRRHAMVGNVALAKILYLQGAVEIHVSLPGFRPFIRDPEDEALLSSSFSSSSPTSSPTSSSPPPPAAADDDLLTSVHAAGVADPRFQAWLRALQAHGNPTPLTPFTSAHQMGTCRMSTDPRRGVVDPRGRVWGAEGLYVADASVFPSASGVNPMVTNMAVADWVARNVDGDLRGEGGRGRL